MRFPALALLIGLIGCTNAVSDVTSTPPAPPPPAPVPLLLSVNPPTRKASAQPGAAAPGDNATITLTGDNASTAAWSAVSGHQWITVTTGSGTGSGTAAWTRSTAGLPTGLYVDTIRFTVNGAVGSPSYVIDTLQITTAPVPLTLVVGPLSRGAAVTQGVAAPDDNVAITLSGDNAATTAWTATKRQGWTSLVAAGGTGSGSLAWHRSTTALAVGTYVDTIMITAPGAIGAPIAVYDTVRITAPPVPLTLTVSPPSRGVTVIQGAVAPVTNATVTLTGDNAATTNWTASKKKAWTALTTASGAGNGTVAWTRNTAPLLAGTYVDTITVVATGAIGSPATVIDTVIVTAPPSSGPVADLGVLADLHGKQVLPPNDPWNQPVDTAQVDPLSAGILGKIGLTRALHPDWGCCYPSSPFGFPYTVVPDNTPRFPFIFDYGYQSDPGPYPIPANPAIEGGGDLNGDSHLLIITQNEWKLYETYYTHNEAGLWYGGSGAIFDLTNGTKRPDYWTSADAAGLPIFPGLVRYDEVYGRGVINHAIRFTVTHSRAAFIAPATHWASSSTDPLNAPMGMRVRLKASFDISGYPAPMQVILRALKKYGMIVADNGGDFFVSGTADARWDDDMDNLLKQVKVGDFEVVKMGTVISN